MSGSLLPSYTQGAGATSVACQSNAAQGSSHGGSRAARWRQAAEHSGTFAMPAKQQGFPHVPSKAHKRRLWCKQIPFFFKAIVDELSTSVSSQDVAIVAVPVAMVIGCTQACKQSKQSPLQQRHTHHTVLAFQMALRAARQADSRNSAMPSLPRSRSKPFERWPVTCSSTCTGLTSPSTLTAKLEHCHASLTEAPGALGPHLLSYLTCQHSPRGVVRLCKQEHQLCTLLARVQHCAHGPRSWHGVCHPSASLSSFLTRLLQGS